MTLIPDYSTSDYLRAYLAALPDGPAWNKDPDSTMSAVVDSLMPTYARLSAAAKNMIADSFPASTINLIDEWQSSLGLPDPCLGLNPTLAAEQNQIVARLTDNGGQSLPYFVQYAANLGYNISITTFRAPLVGYDKVGFFKMLPREASFWLVINAEPIAAQNKLLECEFANKARGTYTLFYNYSYGTSLDGVVTGTNTSTYDIYNNDPGNASSTTGTAADLNIYIIDDITATGAYLVDDITGSNALITDNLFSYVIDDATGGMIIDDATGLPLTISL